MSASDFTADQYEAAISRALKAHDVQAVGDLMVGLAAVDIQRANDMLTVLQAGLILADRKRADQTGDTE